MKDTLINIFVTAIMVALSLDLLYLYIASGWQDPIKAIAYSELIIFTIFVIFGVVRIINLLKHLH